MNAVVIRHRARRAALLCRRIAVLVAGVVVIAVGLVLLALPGPGIPLVIGGLALLAREFRFARLLLERGRAHALRVLSRLRRTGPGTRRRRSRSTPCDR